MRASRSFSRRGAGTSLLLLSTVALTSVQYIGIGVPIALRFKTVSGYLMGSAGFLTPVIAPAFLALLDPFPDLARHHSVGEPVSSHARRDGRGVVGSDRSSPLMLAISVASAAGGIWIARRALLREFGR